MKTLSNLFKVIVITLVLCTTNTYASKNNSKISIFNAVASINSEWKNPTFSLSNIKQEEVNFSALSEQDKIKLHLQQVLNLLRSQTPANLTYAQKSNRDKNIALLAGYMQNGVFPRNITHKNRIPVFVDDRDVPCAVGYLMLKAGYNEFVATTRANSNNIYIKQINSDVFEQFKQESGFTLDELALIQPCYGGSYYKVDLILNSSTEIQSTVADTINNVLYVAGKLESLNKDGIKNLAKFDGTNWSSMPNEISGDFKTMAIVNGDLFIAGQFKIGENQTPASLVSFSSKGWQIIPLSGEIRTLYTFVDKLLIGGNFKNAEESNFAIYDTKLNKFETTNSKFNGTVNAITVHDGNIVVGGEFTLNGNSNQMYLSQIIANNWEAIPMENVDTVFALSSGKHYKKEIENSLIVGYKCSVINNKCENLLYLKDKSKWKNISEWVDPGLNFFDSDFETKITQLILNNSDYINLKCAIKTEGKSYKGNDTTIGFISDLDPYCGVFNNDFPVGILSIEKLGQDYFITSENNQIFKSDLIVLSVDFDNPYKDEITNISSNSNEFVFKLCEKAERNLSFKLFNLVGEEIINYSEAMPNKDVLAVNKINLASGCYIANITKDNKVYNLKVLVKN